MLASFRATSLRPVSGRFRNASRSYARFLVSRTVRFTGGKERNCTWNCADRKRRLRTSNLAFDFPALRLRDGTAEDRVRALSLCRRPRVTVSPCMWVARVYGTTRRCQRRRQRRPHSMHLLCTKCRNSRLSRRDIHEYPARQARTRDARSSRTRAPCTGSTHEVALAGLR
jgi:hypothetical protein